MNYSAELFAGAGGLALGFEKAGFKHRFLAEIDKHAASTLRANFDCPILEADVSDIDFKPYKGKVDVLCGGFPCQAFSAVGHRKGFDDKRGLLFFQLARAVEEIQPKIVVGENVKGLLSHDNGYTFQVMVSTLRKLGYHVQYRVLKAYKLGVPQLRERLIIIAYRKDLKLRFAWPVESENLITVRQALHNCPESDGLLYTKNDTYYMQFVPEGGRIKDMPVDKAKAWLGDNYVNCLDKGRRLSWDRPSYTITTTPIRLTSMACHPEETRPLTIRESARIQTFPDNWDFKGGLYAVYKQIGNAVPVELGYRVGLAVKAMLSGKCGPKVEFVKSSLDLF